MKVMINISSITQKHRGMGVFTKRILLKILEDNTFEFILVSCCNVDCDFLKKIRKKNNIVFVKKIYFPLPIFEQLVIPILIKKYQPDICWFPSNTFPLIKPKKTKFIATIHDLIFLDQNIKPKNLYQKIGKLYRSFIVKKGIKKLDAITSVSLSTLKEIVNTFNLSKNNISSKQVLYNSVEVNEKFDESILNRLNLIKNHYFYTISGSAPNKNLFFLIRAFAKYVNTKTIKHIKLVITGLPKKQERKNFVALANSLNIKNQIIFTDFVSEYEKNALLKNCQLFIFASTQEGFGIPLIEALYFNCSTLVSDIPVFREIGKNYCVYFNYKDENFLLAYFNNHHFPLKYNSKKYIQINFSSIKSAKKLKNIFINM